MHIWGWLGSGLLVIITWVLAIHTITVHLTHYNNKSIQRHKVRVLAYPAVYATFAWQVLLVENFLVASFVLGI